MNRNRVLPILLAALIMSGIVTYWAYSKLSPKQATVSIVVAARDLPLGFMIAEQDLKLAVWPKELLPKGHFQDKKEVVNRGVKIEMLANDPVLNDKLTEKGGGVGLTAIIPPDMRAMSIRVDAVIGVAGFVLPGTYVDVIVTGLPRQNDDPTAKVILENVKVLTADKNLESKDQEGKAIESKVVTLLVKPDQAEKLALASSDRIYLALRNPLADPKGENPVNPPYIKKPELYYGSPAAVIEQDRDSGRKKSFRPPPRPPVSGTVEIEVRSGSKTERTTVDREQPSLTRPTDGKM